MRATGGIVIVISSLLLAGCSGTSGDSASPDSTVSVDAPGYPTQTTSAATTPGTTTVSPGTTPTSATPGTTSSSARFTTQVVTTTATVTSPPSAPPTTPAPSPTAPPKATSSATPTAGAAAVDASAYGNSTVGHFFTSPSGRLHCGILPSIAGCQATVVVPDLPQCDNPDTNGPIASVDVNGGTNRGCSSEGIFFGESPKVLPYGASLHVDGFTCTSDAAGVRCTHDGSGRGIRASQQSFGTF